MEQVEEKGRRGGHALLLPFRVGTLPSLAPLLRKRLLRAHDLSTGNGGSRVAQSRYVVRRLIAS